MNPKGRLKQVMIGEGAEGYELTEKILYRLRGEPGIKVIRNGDPYPTGNNTTFPAQGKETLRLERFPGEMFKPCPGTIQYICCGYWILHGATNCPMDCSYCILQSYFEKSSLSVFINIENELNEICRQIENHPNRIFRVGTGEFADSLALDPLVGWTQLLTPRFSRLKNAVLEFKTKTDQIAGLLSSPYRDRIIVSWSMNSPFIVTREEGGTCSLRRRLEAAKRCQQEGYVIGFHFDPIIEHHRWRDGYKRTIEMMDKYIDPRGVIWISLGTMRYMPSLKSIIRARHPGSHVLDGEFIPGLDGKMRYLKTIRIDMYDWMKRELDQWSRDLGVYLCMESDEVWKRSLGWSVKNSEGLARYLDQRVKMFFP
ncbi:MAG: DNA photolyase [Deltaproteobacteria bacterium]|nr:DNA photolyase [Deltaproteobacteria bacterium]MBW2128206.1 DNA photolyase [Deltaproteobacteria bacterium]MBW2303077.1 DNA photolyase [Deltaproteobacteria bacterium]